MANANLIQTPFQRWRTRFETYMGNANYYLYGYIPFFAIIFLTFASTPLTFMFETNFENINDLSIEGFHGVTKISVSFSLFSSLTKKLTSYASSGVSGKDTWGCNILNLQDHTGKRAGLTNWAMVIALCHQGLVRIDMLPNIVRFLAHILFFTKPIHTPSSSSKTGTNSMLLYSRRGSKYFYSPSVSFFKNRCYFFYLTNFC